MKLTLAATSSFVGDDERRLLQQKDRSEDSPATPVSADSIDQLVYGDAIPRL